MRPFFVAQSNLLNSEMSSIIIADSQLFASLIKKVEKKDSDDG